MSDEQARAVEADTQLASARRLVVDYGFAVFPVDYPALKYCRGIKTKTHNPTDCTDRGKHPACKWSEWATTSYELVASAHYFGGGEPRNIGIDCDESSLLVLDEDEDGALDRFCADRGYELVPTFTVRTANGRHLYYRCTGDQGRTGNEEGGFRDYPINVRARAKPRGKAGGYVVGPGSLHESGVIYEIIDWGRPEPVPEWVLDVIAEKPKRTRPRTTHTKPAGRPSPNGDHPWAEIEVVPKGQRHTAVVSVAGHQRETGRTREEAEAALRKLHERMEQPPGDDYPWEEVVAQLEDVYERYEAGVRREDLDREWWRKRERVPSPADHSLWQARQALTVIHDYALSRRTCPWSVLGVVLARVITATSPRVMLPPIVGGHASLNFHLGLVSDSGGGKGSSMEVGREAVRWKFDAGLTEHTVGSGQGIAHAYARRISGGGYEMHTTQTILSVEEVDHFSQKHQQGSTLMPELRRFYMGEKLGHLYVDPNKRVEVAAHSYRGALIVGLQPKRAGALLEDREAAAGTPQRFVWLPADFPDHPDERPPEVPAYQWSKPRDAPPPGHDRIVIDVCSTAWDEIDGFHLRKARGQADPLDGHLLLCREKVAAAFGLLDGRLSITEEDWQLAGEVIELSNDVRGYVVEVLAEQRRSVRQARSEERVETEVAVDVAIRARRTIDGARKLARIVREQPGVTLRGARGRMRSWQDLLHECLDHAKAEQWVIEEPEPGQGKPKRVLRPGPQSSP